MTGFCGVFLRDTRPEHLVGLRNTLELAKHALCRSPEQKIHCVDKGRFFVTFYYGGAFEPDRAPLDRDGIVACISGDPLIVGEDGVSNDPAASVAQLYFALPNAADEILRRAAGVFVGVSWDEENSTLRLCTDRLGMRPLYVFVDTTKCVFATSLRTIRALIGAELELDEVGLAQTIFLDQCIGERTICKNVRVLLPAEVMTVTADDMTTRRYFDWNQAAPREYAEAKLHSTLYDGFMRAIRRRSRYEVEEAFLSGGLDSRCVVAGLLDIGRTVRTFSASYANSLNAVIAKMVAAEFGTAHTFYDLPPTETLLRGVDIYPLYAWQNFPRNPKSDGRGRVMWSGGGGGMVMGHVFVDPDNTERAARIRSARDTVDLFPHVKRRKTRLFAAGTFERWRRLAMESVLRELQGTRPRRPERRLYLFYLLNEQTRHRHMEFEQIDVSGIEQHLPFLDPDFVLLIVAAAPDKFYRHRLYNRWLRLFKAPAAAIAWQAYPGHEAGPHPMPKCLATQWDECWYRGGEARKFAGAVAKRLLHSNDKLLQPLHISRATLIGLQFLNWLGIERYNYELWFAQRLYEAIVGNPASDVRD